MNTNDINDRLKRIESKLTHLMEVNGVCTVSTRKEELNPSKVYLKKENDRFVVEVLSKDVTLAILEKFLENKFGEFDIVCNGKLLWKIRK
jgi:DNA topoisomerase IA